MMAVGEADLDAVVRTRRLAHAGNLGGGEPERLLREHPLVRLERRAHEPRGGGRRRRDHDGVDVGIGQHGLDGRCRTHAVRRSRESLGVEVGDGNERRAGVALDRRHVRADGDLAEADQPDPEDRVVHGATLA